MDKLLFVIIYILASIGILNSYGAGEVTFEMSVLAIIILGFICIMGLFSNITQSIRDLIDDLEYEEYDEYKNNENNLSERLEDDGK